MGNLGERLMFCLALFSTLSAGEAGAQVESQPTGEEPRSLVFLPLRGSEAIVESERIALQEAVAGWFSRRYRVFTRQELVDLVAADRLRQLKDCDGDESCVAEIFDGRLQPWVLSGQVGQVGDELVLSLGLWASDRTEGVSRVGLSGRSVQALKAALPGALSDAFDDTPGAARSGTNFSLPERDISFGVFRLEGAGVEAELVANLAQFLTVELSKIRGARVISPQDVESILGVDRMRMVLGEDCDQECMLDLSGALNVDFMVVGQVGRLDRDHVFALRLIDPREVRVVHRSVITMRGPEEELVRAIRTAARELVGVETDIPGVLALAGPQSGARAWVDGRSVGTLPVRLSEPLPPRRTSVRVSKDGYDDWESDVFIQPGEENVVWAELVRRPNPVTKKWWFWTAVGAGAVGVAGAVAATQLGGTGPPGTFDFD